MKKKIECMIVISLAVLLEESTRSVRKSAVEEITKFLHNTNFNLATFKDMVKTRSDYEGISESLIQRFKEYIYVRLAR